MSNETTDPEQPPAQPDSTDPATDGSDEFASVEELTVKRDETGELLPVVEETPKYGLVKVIPMPYGAIEDKFGDTGDVADVQAPVIAELLDDHVVEPDLSAAAGGQVTAAFVREELKPLVPRDFIMAILSASDVEADVMVDDAGNAQVALEDEGNRY